MSQPWVIILAGGEGVRMCPFAEFCFGEARPKQFCAFCEDRTLLTMTVERACRITEESRILTVIGANHQRYLSRADQGTVLRQPAARGTAVGVFWPLAGLVERYPQEVVLILPSDHFLFPEERASEELCRICSLAEAGRDRVILAGIRPDGPETEYGWILPGTADRMADRVSTVAAFCEKPSAGVAADCYRRGGLWNTMIVAASVATLWRLGERVLPRLTSRLKTLGGRCGEAEAASSPEQFACTFSDLPEADFSRDFLAQIAPQLRVSPLSGLLWSDWGRPERVRSSLAQLEREFPGRWNPGSFALLRRALSGWEDRAGI